AGGRPRLEAAPALAAGGVQHPPLTEGALEAGPDELEPARPVAGVDQLERLPAEPVLDAAPGQRRERRAEEGEAAVAVGLEDDLLEGREHALRLEREARQLDEPVDERELGGRPGAGAAGLESARSPAGAPPAHHGTL